MKNSVFKRIFLYTGLLVVALLVLMLAGVQFWLEDYYYSRQEEAILDAAANIREIYDENPEQVTSALAFYGDNLGAALFITNPSGRVLHSGTPNGMNMGGMMPGFGRFIRTQDMNGMGEEDWLFYSSPLSNGNLLVTRLPYASFERAISVLSRFMLLLTLPLLGIGMLLIYSLARSITKPLIQLNQVAHRMKELDFKAKYTGSESDEIGQLGRTLNELTVQLETTIGRLTRELKKEKTMESMRKEFVARVSHEIRTPVSVIQGYVEAIEDGVYQEEDARNAALGVITSESEKIAKMTQDLLDLSQLESGNYRLHRQKMDFGALVREVHGKFLINKKVDPNLFPLDVPNNEVVVNGDGFRLEQVLNNLLNNAFSHGNGDGLVRISCLVEGDEVITRVFNRGIAIPESELPYLWESFYKGGDKDKGSGVGLGLSIAKSILQLHQGHWSVENRDDGVEFSFSLPKYAED